MIAADVVRVKMMVLLKTSLKLQGGPVIPAGTAGMIVRRIRPGSPVVAVKFGGVPVLGSHLDLTVKVSLKNLEEYKV